MYKCKKCGSTNVQIELLTAWVQQDELGYLELKPHDYLCESDLNMNNCYCLDCDDDTELVKE